MSGAGGVLVVFESSANGAAAIHEAAELVARDGSALTVVALARQDLPNRCCGPGPGVYNCAVREAASESLAQARRLLGDLARSASFQVLLGNPEPPLRSWVAARGFDVVIVPRHRFAIGGHRAARKLRRSGATDVRLVVG